MFAMYVLGALGLPQRCAFWSHLAHPRAASAECASEHAGEGRRREVCACTWRPAILFVSCRNKPVVVPTIECVPQSHPAVYYHDTCMDQVHEVLKTLPHAPDPVDLIPSVHPGQHGPHGSFASCSFTIFCELTSEFMFTTITVRVGVCSSRSLCVHIVPAGWWTCVLTAGSAPSTMQSPSTCPRLCVHCWHMAPTSTWPTSHQARSHTEQTLREGKQCVVPLFPSSVLLMFQPR
jgi:hypothetical protein